VEGLLKALNRKTAERLEPAKTGNPGSLDTYSIHVAPWILTVYM